MNMLPPPLLRRRSLLPGESLPSLLVRLGQANHYVPLSLVIGLAFGQTTEKSYYTDISRALSPTILQRMAALTKLDPLTLYSSTYHPFAPIITSPEIALGSLKLGHDIVVPVFTGKIAQSQFRPEFAAQFCPECLRDSAYHRLLWVPIAVAACLHHKRLLVNRCQDCGKRVLVKEVIETYCSKCKGSLTEAQSLQIHDDLFGLFSQHVIQSWLTGGNISCEDRYALPEQPVRALYRFIDGLRMALMQISPDWSYLHRLSVEMPAAASMKEMKAQSLTPHQSYCLYATALKALINWPQGFFDFLDAKRLQADKDKFIDHAVGDLGLIYEWLEKYWQHPAFAFVQESFDSYFINTYGLKHEVIKSGRYRNNRELVKRFAYMTVREAADLLHTDQEMIKFLVDIGRLTRYESQDTHKYLRLDRSEVIALQAKWLDSMSLPAAAALMDIPSTLIPGLVKIGLLTTTLSPSEGARYWRVSKASITDFMDTLAARCHEMEEKTPVMNLTTASRLYVMKSGLDSAHLFLQAIKGLIRVYHQKDQQLKVRDIFFDRSDIDAHLTSRYAENGWVDKAEAMKLLRTSHKNLYRWVNSGLLTMTKHKNCHLFDKKTIEEFLANHVRSKAAAEILGVDDKDVTVLAHGGFLPAVSGPTIDGYSSHIFRRDSLFHWKKNWLTHKEAAKMLGIEETAVFAFAQQGRIRTLRPLYGVKQTGVVRTWYSSQSVSELREKT